VTRLSALSVWVAVALGGTVSVARTAQDSVLGPLEGPTVFESELHKFRVVPIAKGLSHPWGLAFLPDGRTLLVTERPGRLRIIRDGILDPRPVDGLPAMEDTSYFGGLNDVALHPRFSENQIVYFSYTKSGDLGTTLALARGRLENASLKDVKDIFVADAWSTIREGPYGGRIAFAPDGTLFLTVGDRSNTVDRTVRMRAQMLDSHVGKILRLRDDGTAPQDNPFVGRPDTKPEIYTYGHRNAYGLAFHPGTGALWACEFGPLGGDELNIVLPGKNYGWPILSLGREYDGNPVSEQPWWRQDMEMPAFAWIPAVGPTSISFYAGDQFPRWKGNLFVATTVAKQLQRLTLNSKGQIVAPPEPLLVRQRLRHVAMGPDGLLYVLTEGRMWGADDQGAVLRIEPVP
jgi:aldose sugar dehydrogenase